MSTNQNTTLPFAPRTARHASRAKAADRPASLALVLGGLVTAVIVGSVVLHGIAVALALLMVFIGGVFFGAFRNITTAIAFYIAYASVEGMYKYMTNFSQLIYVIKPLLALVIFVGWAMAKRYNGDTQKSLPLSAIILLFVAWGAMEIFNPLSSGMIAGFVTLLVWYVVPIALYIVGYNEIRSSRQVIQLLYVVMAVCTVVSIFAFVQFSMGRDWTMAQVPGYSNLSMARWVGSDVNGQEVVAFRPASTTSAEGFATLWSNMGTLASLGLMLLPGVPLTRKLLLGGCLLINIGGLLVSGVRLFVIISIMEAFLILVLTSTSERNRRRNLALAVMVAGVAWLGFIAAQGVSNGAIASRYAETLANPLAKFNQERQGGVVGQSAWLTGFLVEHPFGIGYQRGISGDGGLKDDPSSKIVINRETQFAAISDDMGMPGLAIFTALAVAMLVTAFKAFRRLKNIQLKTLAAILFITLIGYTIGYWGGQMLIAVGDYIWLFLGMLLALPALERREKARGADTPPAGAS